jgi:hypothetical protein
VFGVLLAAEEVDAHEFLLLLFDERFGTVCDESDEFCEHVLEANEDERDAEADDDECDVLFGSMSDWC